MAEANSRTGATAPNPPHGGLPPGVDINAIDDHLNRLKSFSNLIEWIDNARNFIGGIETRAAHDATFRAELKTLDFASSMVDWDEYVAEGMQVLQGAIRDSIQTISDATRAGVPQ
jgi:hypothetical protein